MSKKRIAIIAGDGIGQEVMPEGLRVMEAAASKFNMDLQFVIQMELKITVAIIFGMLDIYLQLEVMLMMSLF